MPRAISPSELAEALRKDPDAYTLLDVREAEERNAARIEPSIHIPMNELPGRLGEIPKGRPIVVYCHHGGRSEMVIGYLDGQGFKNLANLTGGIDQWSRQVDPKVPRYF